MNKEELTQLFSKLGALDPEEWATSQVEEGINQLGRFLFLREAWRAVVDENDHSWIQAEITAAQENPGAPCSGIGAALQRLLDKGASSQDITDVVRVMQYGLLFRLCYLLSDPGFEEPELQDFGWALVEINTKDEIVGSIDSLHESLLETDPTGREMRPRDGG